MTYIGLANEALKSFIQANIAEKAGERAELMDTWVWFQVAIMFKDVVRFVIALPPPKFLEWPDVSNIPKKTKQECDNDTYSDQH